MKEIQQDNQLVATWLAARRLHTASWGSCVSTTHQWRLRIKFINCQWLEIKNKQTSCTGSAFPRNKTKEDRFNLHTHCPMAHSDLTNVFWISCGCPYCSDRIHAPSIVFIRPSQSLCELIQQHSDREVNYAGFVWSLWSRSQRFRSHLFVFLPEFHMLCMFEPFALVNYLPLITTN